jgi:hypothetical protein
MFVARVTAYLSLGALLSACGSGVVEPNHLIQVVTPILGIAWNDASANGQFTGTVMGHPLIGDSAVVGGATVIVYIIKVASGAQDTLPNQQPDSIGTITAGSDGRFALAKISGGLYALRAIPPASSPYAETDLWEFVSDGKSSMIGDVGMYPK